GGDVCALRPVRRGAGRDDDVPPAVARSPAAAGFTVTRLPPLADKSPVTRTYMRSDSFKPSSPSAKPQARSASARGSEKLPEDELPDTPPPTLRAEYLKVSWAYVYWCAGMLVWSILCVVYFIMTRQTTNMLIGMALGVLLVAMIVLPAMLFGGKTWY